MVIRHLSSKHCSWLIVCNNNLSLCLFRFVDAKRKTLETGAVPTKNLPSKRHDLKPSYRCPLVREISSECPLTSALPPVDIDKSFEEFVSQVKETLSLPWIIKEGSDLGIRMEH